MMEQAQKTVEVLQNKLKEEQEKREKADEEMKKMQQVLVSLTRTLDEKADSKSIEHISNTLTTIQSVVRSEQTSRSTSEKQIKMIKAAMTTLLHRTERKEKEVHVVREVQ